MCVIKGGECDGACVWWRGESVRCMCVIKGGECDGACVWWRGESVMVGDK